MIYISEALRFIRRRLHVYLRGIRKYQGSPQEIGFQILADCYNKKNDYFMVSNANFRQFYCRDFGWCTEALIKLGYKKEVLSTLSYALGVFEKYGAIEQCITPSGKPFTFPNKYSPDALAFIIRSLRLAKARALVKKHKAFLESEIKRYYDVVVDDNTGLVRSDISFSSMKDYSVRKSSCYDNVMCAMLAEDLPQLRLFNPFKKHDYKKILVDNFWNGKYFVDDLSGNEYVCGDANVLPFWSGVITNKAMAKKSLLAIQEEGLDKPFPLKYTVSSFKKQKMIGIEFLAGKYERNSIWAHVGLMFVIACAKIDRDAAKQYVELYEEQIRKHRNFLEVYDSNGEPFRTLFYYTDESMLWVANYLYLKKIIR